MGNTQNEEVLHLEHKCVGVAGFKALDGDDEQGVVEAIVSVTGLRDNVKDIIKPGAYEKSLKTRTPKGVWHHTWSESVSRTEDIKELLPGDPELPETLPDGRPWPADAGALKVKTRFNLNTQRGREAYEDVIFFGDQQEWSIGYNVPVGGATVDSKTGVRSIHTLDLYEYSPVLFGAMPSARTSSVKEAQLAYKTLQGEDVADVEEAPTTPEVVEQQDDDYPEEVPEQYENDGFIEDDEYEGKAWGYLDDNGHFVKSAPRAITVGAGQAQKVYRAIASLTELLRDMQVEMEEAVEEEPEVAKDEEVAPEERDDFSNTSLADLLRESGIEDEEAFSAAEDFDAALGDEDRELMEETADQVIDAIESAIEDGADSSGFSQVGGYIAWAIEKVGDPEEDGEEEPEDEEDAEDEEEMEEKSVGRSQMVLFDLSNIEDVLA